MLNEWLLLYHMLGSMILIGQIVKITGQSSPFPQLYITIDQSHGMTVYVVLLSVLTSYLAGESHFFHLCKRNLGKYDLC